MPRPLILPGDEFATRNPMALGRGICAVEKFWSRDCEAEYSHTGIFQDPKGKTFEALWTYKSQDFWAAYQGEKAIISRAVLGPDMGRIKNVIGALVETYQGKWYPVWRLPMHIFPPLAKIAWAKRPVCAELNAMYEWMIGVRHKHWASTNPDTKVDEWRQWDAFEIIWEGVVE